jgi:hypothetical protein
MVQDDTQTTQTTGTVLAGIDPLVKLNDARRHSSDHHLCVLREETEH